MANANRFDGVGERVTVAEVEAHRKAGATLDLECEVALDLIMAAGGPACGEEAAREAEARAFRCATLAPSLAEFYRGVASSVRDHSAELIAEFGADGEGV